MADITYVGESHVTYASRAAQTPVSPVVGVALGDLMVMEFLVGASSGTGTPGTLPSGWAVVPGLPESSVSVSGFRVTVTTWYKFAGASEAGFNVGHYTGGTFATQWSMRAWRGVDPTTPFDVNGVYSSSTDTASEPNVAQHPGITTVTNNCMIAWFMHDWGDVANNLVPPAGSTPTFTEDFDVAPLIYGAHGILATAGATGAKTQTANSTDTASAVSQMYALRPAVTAPAAPYTEVEWNVGVQAPAVNAEVYQFRVQDGTTPFSSYPVTAQLTIGDPPSSNPIVVENALTGYAASNWQISGIGDTGALGFTTAMSVQAGSTIDFKIHSGGTAYTLEIIRLGWYGGTGARLITTINHPAGATQPEGTLRTQGEGGVGSRDCSNWTVTDSWTVPEFTSCHGVYLGVIKRSGQGTYGHVGPFVVHTDYSSENPIVVKLSDMTWRAYNTMGTLAAPSGGKSIYGTGSGTFSQGDRAWDVTYDAPLVTNAGVPQTAYWNGEQPVHTWLERNGYDVSYVSCLDVEAQPNILLGRQAIVSLGHDEYWSQTIRDAWDVAIDSGVNAIVWSGNTMLWRVRMSGRRMICYKNSHSLDGTGSGTDPVEWTGTWRDTRWTSRNPENRSIGTMFVSNGIRADEIIVPGTYASEPLWRNTTVASLSSGSGTTHAWVGATPTAVTTDAANYELGTHFTLYSPIVITGVRIWNPGLIAPQGGQNRTATLWSHNGTGGSPVVLRTVDIPDLLPTGWSEHSFSTSYSAPTGVNYMISYFVDSTGSAPGADYGYVAGALSSAVGYPPISFDAGYFIVTSTPGTIPNGNTSDFYGVEVVYETTGGAPATETLKADCLGMEWDSYEPYYSNSMKYPAGLKLLSNAPVNLTGNSAGENGSTYSDSINPAKHYIVAFKKGTAIVVNFGTNQWGWGLSDFHNRGAAGENATMKQATVNLLADLGLQPGSIQSGLTPATLTAWSFPTASTMSTTTSVTLGAVAATSQLVATTTWSNGITTDNVDYVTWGTSDAGVATVSSTGVVTAVGAGTATITGTYGALSDTTAVTVDEAPVGAPAYVGESHTSYTAGLTTTIVNAVPGIANGDYMTLTFLMGRGDAIADVTRPSGWLDVPGLSQPSVESQAGYYVKQWTWYRFASSEPASYTISHASTTASTQASIVAYRGVNPTTPFDVAPSYAYTAAAVANAPITVPGITTVTDNALITWFQHGWGDTADNLVPPTCTGLTFTERFDVAALIYGADGVKVTAGATGNVTQAATNSNDGAPRIAQIIALRPAATSGGTNYNETGRSVTIDATVVLPTQTYTPGTSATLILSYNFNESGTTAIDRSGNGRNAGMFADGWVPTDLHSAGEFVPPSTGHRLFYDAASDAAARPVHASVAVKLRTLSTIGSGNIWARMRAGDSSTFNLYFSAEGTVNAVVRGSSGVAVLSSAAGVLTANTTYHIALTYDGAMTRLYVGGSEILTTASTTGDLDWSGTDKSWQSFDHILDSTVAATPFILDDLRFYDGALTASEVAALVGVPVTGGGTNYNETGRTVAVTATIATVDQADWKSNTGLSVPAVVTVALVEQVDYKSNTGLSVPAVVTVTTTAQVDYKSNVGLSVPVAATVTCTDTMPPIPTTGLVGWWDSDDAVTITASAGAVSQWTDKSVNARQATQATGSLKPTTGTRTLNGRNALDFNDDMLGYLPITLSQPITLFVVVQADVADGTNRQVVGNWGTNPTIYVTANTWNIWNGSNLDSLVAVDFNPHYLRAVFNGASSGLWIDGATAITGTLPATGWTAQTFGIGAGDNTGPPGYFWDGLITSVIAYDRVLTAPEITRVESYLNTRWIPAPTGTNYNETGRSVTAVATVTMTEQVDWKSNVGLSVPVTATVTATDQVDYKSNTGLAVPVTATVATADQADFKETATPLSIPAVATFTAPTQTFTHLGNFNETGRSVNVVGTVTVPTEQADYKSNVGLAVTVVATVTAPADKRKNLETALAVPAAASVTEINQADFKTFPVLSVSIAASIDSTDNQSSPGHFDETNKSIDIASSVTVPTQQTDYHQLALSVPVTGVISATALLGYHQAVLSIPVAATTTITTLIKRRDLDVSIPIVGELTATTQADFKSFPTPSIPLVAVVTVLDDISREGENRRVDAVATVTLAVEQVDFRNLALSVPVAAAVTIGALLRLRAFLGFSVSATVTRTDKMGSTLVTVLNDADALYLGDEVVDRIYCGAVQVWP